MLRTRSTAARLALAAAALAAGAGSLALLPAARAATPDPLPATPGVPCDAGSLPESTQGRVPLADVTSGRAAKGYDCNARKVSQFGVSGGYQVQRYVDRAGHDCAFYDTTLLLPRDAVSQGTEGTGTYVMDMADPAHPVHTDTLRTPAMQSPHESLRVNARRGLLVADMGYPTFNPGFVDVYDVSADCRHPVLDSSTPLGVLGHESGFSPDGNTYYVSSLYGHTIAAVDLTNPVLPSVVWASADYEPHGLSVSDDGDRLYMTENPLTSGFAGVTILDTSQIQKRVLNPTVPIVSRVSWPHHGTAQIALPITEHGHPYLVEDDEFGTVPGGIGAGRIIDISDEKKPFVVSNLRLAVNQPSAETGPETGDPGFGNEFQGYRAHYCAVPTRVDPALVACSFIMSGLRVFDIEDPRHPQEVAYYNAPVTAVGNAVKAGSFALSAPAFDLARHEIWYSDGNSAFYVIRLTAGAHRTAGRAATGSSAAPVVRQQPAGRQLPRTGASPALALLAVTLCAAALLPLRRGRLEAPGRCTAHESAVLARDT